MTDYHPISKKAANLALRIIDALEAIDDGTHDDPYVSEVVIGWYEEPAARVVPNEFGGFDLVPVPVAVKVPSIPLREMADDA